MENNSNKTSASENQRERPTFVGNKYNTVACDHLASFCFALFSFFLIHFSDLFICFEETPKGSLCEHVWSFDNKGVSVFFPIFCVFSSIYLSYWFNSVLSCFFFGFWHLFLWMFLFGIRNSVMQFKYNLFLIEGKFKNYLLVIKLSRL